MIKEEVIKVWVEVDIKEVRRTGGRDREGREMIVVRSRNKNQKIFLWFSGIFVDLRCLTQWTEGNYGKH